MATLIPTTEVYAELQQAFDHFNNTLFAGELPACVITLQREGRTFGYFSNSRFARRSGERSDEIAMNPSYFAVRSIRETLSTLAHEMVHQWQCRFGRPGRRGYHNKEWAARMEQVGLMPSDTGEPGGRKVGERMTHYIIDGGPFDAACRDLLTRDFTLSWVDRFPPVRPSVELTRLARPLPSGDLEDEETPLQGVSALVELPPEQPLNRTNRVKYRCARCLTHVWGKPGLRVLCGGEACETGLLVAL